MDVCDKVVGSETGFETEKNSAHKIIPGRLKENFDAVKLSKKNLRKAEISLLYRGLKFVLTLNNKNEATLKEELKLFGFKLCFNRQLAFQR